MAWAVSSGSSFARELAESPRQGEAGQMLAVKKSDQVRGAVDDAAIKFLHLVQPREENQKLASYSKSI